MKQLISSVVATAMVLMSACDMPAEQTNVSANAVDGNATTDNSSAAEKSTSSNWSYSEDKDEMRGVSTKVATTESTETFPDAFGMGSQATELEIQKRSNGKIEVSLDNQNLQYTCNSFMNTHVSMKFDNGSVARFGCTNAVGDKYGVAFINPGSKVAQKIKSSKMLIVETEVYQRGYVQQTFNISGLKM